MSGAFRPPRRGYGALIKDIIARYARTHDERRTGVARGKFERGGRRRRRRMWRTTTTILMIVTMALVTTQC